MTPEAPERTARVEALVSSAYIIYRQAMLQTGKPRNWRLADEQERKAWLRVVRFIIYEMEVAASRAGLTDEQIAAMARVTFDDLADLNETKDTDT